MALDVSSFVARFPEFSDVADVSPDTIEAALSTAQTFCSETRWGSSYEAGVMYKAADLLAMSPMGENARLDKTGKETTYGVVFQSLLRKLPHRFLVPGMPNSGY